MPLKCLLNGLKYPYGVHSLVINIKQNFIYILNFLITNCCNIKKKRKYVKLSSKTLVRCLMTYVQNNNNNKRF